MSPNDKLLAAIFGFSSQEEAARAAEEKAREEAVQSEKDWYAAKEIAALANAEFGDVGEWFPALSFGWQPHAVCITDEGARMASIATKNNIYHYAPDEYTISETEVKGA